MKACDLMVPVEAYLMPGEGVQEFFENIRKVRTNNLTAGVRTLPVLDVRGNLLGVLSMIDILRAIHPSYMDITDLGLFTWDGMLESMASRIANKTVGDLMTKQVITVKTDHPLMECVDRMLRHGISTLPVVDHEGRLVGMLYECLLLFAIADAISGANR